ncbi:MAG: hypothetical protein ACM3VX_09245 [Bacteroidota bacterium]
MRPTHTLAVRAAHRYLDQVAGPRVCVVGEKPGQAVFPAAGRRIERRTAEEWEHLAPAAVGQYDTVFMVVDGTADRLPESVLARRAAHTTAVVCLAGVNATPGAKWQAWIKTLAGLPGARFVSYGLLDENPWLKSLWAEDYAAVLAEGERLLEDPLAADWLMQVEHYLVAGLPAGCTANLLCIVSEQPAPVTIAQRAYVPFRSRSQSGWEVGGLHEWASLLAEGFLGSEVLQIESFKHSQSPAVLNLMRYLDRNVFLRAIRRPLLEQAFGAAFLDCWAVDWVRRWYRIGEDPRLTEYKGLPLGEPAEYDQLRLVLAAIRAGGR